MHVSRYLQPIIVIPLVTLIAAGAVLFVYLYGGRRAPAAYVHPTQAAIEGIVSTPGVVTAAESVDLSFEASGRIVSVSGKVGAHVSRGQVLAAVSSQDIAAQLESAQATLAMQQAKLASVKAGARPEDIAVSEASVAGAETALAQSKQTVSAAESDAYVKADDAIHNKVDQIFSNPRSSSPTLIVRSSDTSLQNSVLMNRGVVEGVLSAWSQSLSSVNDPSQGVADTRSRIASISTYLDSVAALLSGLTPTSDLPIATIQKYQNDVNTARANLSQALNALNAADTQEKGAESSLTTARSQLSLKRAPAQSSDVAVQEAQVAAAQAAIDGIEAQLSKTVIRAPISGTVTKNDAHVGSTATPGMPLISLNSDARFQIEAHISEADIAKVHVGDVVRASLDAYPEERFAAHVVSVDPSASIEDGVSTYRVVMQFDANDEKIKAGLTGTTEIIIDTKESTLVVPTSAIVTRGDKTYVLKQVGTSDVLTEVTVGISGKNKTTEIVSGLTASDAIRSFGNQ